MINYPCGWFDVQQLPGGLREKWISVVPIVNMKHLYADLKKQQFLTFNVIHVSVIFVIYGQPITNLANQKKYKREVKNEMF